MKSSPLQSYLLRVTFVQVPCYHTSYIKNKGLFNGMNQSILRRNFFTLTVEMYNKIIIIKAIASIIISPP